jgi:hypothetical protein
MVSKGKLGTTLWSRERGRHSTVYFDEVHQPPFKDDLRCGLCMALHFLRKCKSNEWPEALRNILEVLDRFGVLLFIPKT